MTVENVTYIDDLDPAYPDGSDVIAEGDDHIRNIKKSIKATFPMVSSEVPLSVKGDGITGFESSTEFGAGPDSNHNFIGDVFVGYDTPIAQPDEANGTLLCARGILVGRGGTPGSASIGMEGNIIWGLGDPKADDHAVSLGYIKQFFEGVEIDTSVSDGSEDGETISWNAAAEMWMKNDLLKVQTADGEVIVDNMLVTQAVDGPTQNPVIGHHGMVYKAEKYDNANDPWSGINGLDWEVGFVRPRDDGKNTSRKNGYDIVSDRFTVRLTRDYSTTDWWETQIVFRADGDQLELGSRKNPQTVKINGALTCTNSTELGNDNADQHVLHGDVYVGYLDANNVPDTAKGDTTPGTLFISRGVKLVVDPATPDGQAPSFNCGGHKIVQLANATSDDQAPNWGQVKSWVRNRNIEDNVSVNNNRIEDLITNWDSIRDAADVEGVFTFGGAFRDSILAAIQTSSDFDTFKQRLTDALENFDVRAAAKGIK